MSRFAHEYAEAWCSQKPERVASFFSEHGSLKVNDGEPAVGREGIAKVAASFMTAFPDLLVTMDRYHPRPEGGGEFHWTLTGTNTGPDGTGKPLRISGYEEWTFDDQGLIAESIGHFNNAEFDRQIREGV